jgi:hypothetical protein
MEQYDILQQQESNWLFISYSKGPVFSAEFKTFLTSFLISLPMIL